MLDTSALTAPEEGGEGGLGGGGVMVEKSDTSGGGERRLTNHERRLRGTSNFAKDRDQHQQEKEQLKSKMTVPTVTVFGRSLSLMSSDGDDHVRRGEMTLHGLSSGERDSFDESLGSGSIVMSSCGRSISARTR